MSAAFAAKYQPGRGRFATWNIDHDHQTGKVRGLLCGFCNSLLGYAKDDPATLESAIRYLEAK
jgi:hypothetical protein